MLGWKIFCVTSSAPFQQPEDVAPDRFGTCFLGQCGGGLCPIILGNFK